MEAEEIARLAAERLAAYSGMTIEQALEGLAFQDRAHDVIDGVERALGDGSGDLWFDWSDRHGRLKIGITTRVEPERVEEARGMLQSAGLADRADFVPVTWSMRELREGQARAQRLLESLDRISPVSTGIDPSTNSVVFGVPDDLTTRQLELVEAAIREAGVPVRKEPGGGWALPAHR